MSFTEEARREHDLPRFNPGVKLHVRGLSILLEVRRRFTPTAKFSSLPSHLACAVNKVRDTHDGVGMLTTSNHSRTSFDPERSYQVLSSLSFFPVRFRSRLSWCLCTLCLFFLFPFFFHFFFFLLFLSYHFKNVSHFRSRNTTINSYLLGTIIL